MHMGAGAGSSFPLSTEQNLSQGSERTLGGCEHPKHHHREVRGQGWADGAGPRVPTPSFQQSHLAFICHTLESPTIFFIVGLHTEKLKITGLPIRFIHLLCTYSVPV